MKQIKFYQRRKNLKVGGMTPQLIVILRCVTFGAETREWKGLDCETLAGFHVSATYALTTYLKQVQVILGLDNSEQTYRF
ncbi:hypothetical protein OUZ56_005938 [Daphnia magna]|uniref:Uncharacterized protein n=1 Tax=Daphnia magna TaxID=35525 RepID=A0ABQ9YUD7_9CRUS|nr:hypothetical protein OUZ56_005938 [Daphnia magna]